MGLRPTWELSSLLSKKFRVVVIWGWGFDKFQKTWAWADTKDPENHRYLIISYWLVVSTPLKNISQWEGLSHILWKIKNVPNHQSAYHFQNQPTCYVWKRNFPWTNFHDFSDFPLTSRRRASCRSPGASRSGCPAQLMIEPTNIEKHMCVRCVSWNHSPISIYFWGWR